MGFKSYVIDRVGQVKILCLLTRWVGGSKKGSKHAYVIYEWSLIYCVSKKIAKKADEHRNLLEYDQNSD